MLIYIDNAIRQRQIDQYNVSLLTAQMSAVNLANSFREKGARPLEYPPIHEVYGWEAPKSELDPFELRKQQLRARLATRRKQA